MAIYQIVTASVKCDTCKKLVAFLELPAAVQEKLEKAKVTCADCHSKEGDSNE